MTEIEHRHLMIDVLLMEVEQMDENIFQPPIAPLKEDRIVGEAQVYTRKLWATAQLYSKRVEELAIECRYSTPKEAKRIQPQVFEAAQKRDVLSVLAWLCARSDANYWKNNIGMRRGWKIVAPDAVSHQSFMQKISGIFSGEEKEDDDEDSSSS